MFNTILLPRGDFETQTINFATFASLGVILGRYFLGHVILVVFHTQLSALMLLLLLLSLLSWCVKNSRSCLGISELEIVNALKDLNVEATTVMTQDVRG